MIDARQIAGSAGYFVQDVDPAWNATLVHMTRADFQRSNFLDGRISIQPTAERYKVPFAELNALLAPHPIGRADYIFHISHVGSTLVSKSLGVLPQLLSLREPMLLRWLADAKRTVGEAEGRMDAAGYNANLATALKLLSRPCEGSERTVIKATSFANVLSGDIMRMQPDARAIAVYVPLETFLATILKGRGGWSDILSNATNRLKRLHRMMGYQRWRLAAMRPGEIVAMSWMTEIATLSMVERRHGRPWYWVDFNAYLATPEAQLGAMAGHLGLNWTERESDLLHRSNIAATYSKADGIAYDGSQRDAELATVRANQATEIAHGLTWTEHALREHPALAQAVRELR